MGNLSEEKFCPSSE